MYVKQFNDAETLRQQRNLTNSQRKNYQQVKEGVVVNSLVKENEQNLNSSKDLYIISDNEHLPNQLYNDRKIVDKKLIPLSGIALGVMSSVALITAFINRNAKISKNLAKEKWLPAVTRNVNLSKETSQIIYQMVQSPNKKTFIAGAGVLALSAMAFMGKTFFDGFKEIWVKRKEADIQKNLQENLITVETQSFSGKMQIIRSMLSKYSTEFEKYLKSGDDKILPNFGHYESYKPTFTSDNKKQNSSDKGNILLGIATFAGIIGLGFLSLKNLSKSKSHLQDSLSKAKEGIQEVVRTSTESTKEIDKNNLEHMFMSIDGSENIQQFVEEQVNNLNWAKNEKNEYLKHIISKLKTSTTQVNPNIGGDGTPKPAFNSFVDDYRAFFYNWMLDTSNPQFKQLFLGVTGITAAGYGGKLAGDALKEVQVKKINAQTELELQKRLVSTELRNFKSKKDSVIRPLVNEFYKQADSGKSPEELKVLAENILFEIKNGPPFVYS